MGKGIFNIDVEKVFNIKQSEKKFVKLLFFHNFFQGIALALFFTAANTIFLSNYSIDKLPLVYLLSALVLIVIGYTYSYLEERLTIKKLLTIVAITLALSVTFLRLGLEVLSVAWLGFALMIWYKVTNLLGNLEFWGLTSIMFDVRQSKRLFGVISAGEVSAKLIGYLSVPFLVPVIGHNNLILVASISFGICIYFLNRVFKLKGDDSENIPERTTRKKEKREGLLKKYLNSDFIVLLSILSFLSILVFTFIDFSFLSNVKQQYADNDQEMAIFFGYFFAFSKGITLLVKLFFTGRIIDLLGVKKSLLLLPIMFIVIIISIIIYTFIAANDSYMIFLFAFLMLIHEIFRFALHEPVFFSLFQPLQKKMRLFGHAIVNGFLNPIAIGITGGILLLVVKINDSGASMNFISYILLVVIAGWIIIVIITNRQYIIVLQDAVNNRHFEGSEISIEGNLIHDILSKKLNSSFPEEVIYSAELLHKFDKKENFEKVLNGLLSNPSEEIQLYALKKIEELKITYFKDSVFEIIENESISNKIKEAAIKAYCLLDENPIEKINPLLEHKTQEIRKGAITGLLKNGGLEAVVLAGQQLLENIQSDEPKKNISALEIMGELKITKFDKPIIKFLKYEDINIKKAAINASSEILNKKFIPFLISFLQDSNFQQDALFALANFKDDAVDTINSMVGNEEEQLNTTLIFRFCQICGNIGGAKSHDTLIKFIDYPNEKIKNEALLSLKKSSFKASGKEAIIKRKFEEQFEHAVWLYNSLNLFSQIKDEDISLYKSLKFELDAIKENLFNILSFLYDTRTILKAKEGLLLGFGEQKSNALEIIDNIVSAKMSSKLAIILEDLPLDERISKLNNYSNDFNYTKEDVINFILKEKEKRFNSWTIVASINAIKYLQKPSSLVPAIIPFLEFDEKILNEITSKVLNAFVVENKIEEKFLKELLLPDKFQSIMETLQKSESNVLMNIEKVIILKSTSLFSETPENILVDIANIIEEERIEEGTEIFKKGDMGFCMYIINEGEIRIHDDKLTFAIFKNRDFFGELALLDPEPRSASATALKDTLLLRLEQDAFYEVMSERMEVAKGILKILCRRLREQNERISKLKSQVSE